MKVIIYSFFSITYLLMLLQNAQGIVDCREAAANKYNRYLDNMGCRLFTGMYTEWGAPIYQQNYDSAGCSREERGEVRDDYFKSCDDNKITDSDDRQFLTW
jgi:hypothetical protein